MSAPTSKTTSNTWGGFWFVPTVSVVISLTEFTGGTVARSTGAWRLKDRLFRLNFTEIELLARSLGVTTGKVTFGDGEIVPTDPVDAVPSELDELPTTPLEVPEELMGGRAVELGVISFTGGVCDGGYVSGGSAIGRCAVIGEETQRSTEKELEVVSVPRYEG